MSELNGVAEQLFKYGPYAVLALFSLWVGPRQTRIFIQSSTDDKGTRYFCGVIAATCWLVVPFMTYFIYQNWPPKTIYLGSLGKHGENIEFITTDDDFYISSVLARGTLQEWKFAIITRSTDFDKKKEYSFTQYWGEGDDDYTEYLISEEYLKGRQVKLRSNPDNPKKLEHDHDGDPDTENVEYGFFQTKNNKTFFAHRFALGVAYAADNDELIKRLNSSNRRLQAHGRKEIRGMKISELEILLSDTRLNKKAHQYVESEVRRRKKR